MNKNLRDFTEKELKEELERREASEAPQIKSNIDWNEVISQAKERRDTVLNGSYHEDGNSDDPQYMFEEVMNAVFGDKYFEWENKRTT